MENAISSYRMPSPQYGRGTALTEVLLDTALDRGKIPDPQTAFSSWASYKRFLDFKRLQKELNTGELNCIYLQLVIS